MAASPSGKAEVCKTSIPQFESGCCLGTKMKEDDSFQEQKLNNLVRSVYFLPMVGLIPTIWSKKNNSDTPTANSALKIHTFWSASYVLLWLGSLQASETLAFRLLYLNTIVTSGYVVTCFYLMFRTWRGKK